jgi:hypothetical protein
VELSLDLKWNQAPGLEGSVLPRGIQGRLLPLPAFVAEAAAGGVADLQLVQWKVEAVKEGTGQVGGGWREGKDKGRGSASGGE